MSVQSCIPSQLSLFDPIPINTGITKCETFFFNPITSIDKSSVIEFNIPGSTDHYKDLSSIFLSLKVQFLKADGEKYQEKTEGDKKQDEETTQPALVTNCLSSLFKSAAVYFNNKQISFVDNFHYNDYIVKILNYDSNCISTFLELQGFIPDSGADLDKLEKEKNGGFIARRKLTLNSKIHEFIGRLNIDVFNLHNLLCNNIDIRILLNLENPNFFILEKSTQTSILKIVEAQVGIKMFTINPSILLDHHQMLSKVPMTYGFRKTEIKSYVVSPNVHQAILDNCYVGRIPSSIVIGIVPNLHYNGSREKNPYNFNHHNVSNITVYLNGVSMSSISTDYSNNQYSNAYHQLFEGTGKLYSNNSNSISYKNFKTGFCLLPFNLSPTSALEQETCGNPPLEGVLKIEIKFGTVPGNALTVLLWAEFDAVMQINKNFEVSIQ